MDSAENLMIERRKEARKQIKQQTTYTDLRAIREKKLDGESEEKFRAEFRAAGGKPGTVFVGGDQQESFICLQSGVHNMSEAQLAKVPAPLTQQPTILRLYIINTLQIRRTMLAISKQDLVLQDLHQSLSLKIPIYMTL